MLKSFVWIPALPCLKMANHEEKSLPAFTAVVSYRAAGSVRGELDEKKMRRLYGYLVRRGFGYSDIADTLENMNIRLPN